MINNLMSMVRSKIYNYYYIKYIFLLIHEDNDQVHNLRLQHMCLDFLKRYYNSLNNYCYWVHYMLNNFHDKEHILLFQQINQERNHLHIHLNLHILYFLNIKYYDILNNYYFSICRLNNFHHKDHTISFMNWQRNFLIRYIILRSSINQLLKRYLHNQYNHLMMIQCKFNNFYDNISIFMKLHQGNIHQDKLLYNRSNQIKHIIQRDTFNTLKFHYFTMYLVLLNNHIHKQINQILLNLIQEHNEHIFY